MPMYKKSGSFANCLYNVDVKLILFINVITQGMERRGALLEYFHHTGAAKIKAIK